MTLDRLIRGAPFASWAGIAYPRAAEEPIASRLPMDTLASAAIPAGVRIEFEGMMEAVAIRYRCVEGPVWAQANVAVSRQVRTGTGRAFELWSGDRLLDSAPADAGGGEVRLATGGSAGPFTVHLPELMLPLIEGVTGIGGMLSPRSGRERWIAHGDSITEGWSAESTGANWASIVARRLDLDMVNLGFGGSARGELAMAQMIAALPGEIVTIAFGTNNWSRTPHDTRLFGAVLASFLDTIERGEPRERVLCISPILRPDAEETQNVAGATLGDLRRAFEDAVTARAGRWPALRLLGGRDLVTAEQLIDGVHPADTGHAAMADAIATALRAP